MDVLVEKRISELKLIARYMGGEFTRSGNAVSNEFGFNSVSTLKYDSDWGWLVPVIKKVIEDVNTKFTFEEFDNYRDFVDNQFNLNNRSLEDMFKSVVEMIKTIKHLGYYEC